VGHRWVIVEEGEFRSVELQDVPEHVPGGHFVFTVQMLTSRSCRMRRRASRYTAPERSWAACPYFATSRRASASGPSHQVVERRGEGVRASAQLKGNLHPGRRATVLRQTQEPLRERLEPIAADEERDQLKVTEQPRRTRAGALQESHDHEGASAQS